MPHPRRLLSLKICFLFSLLWQDTYFLTNNKAGRSRKNCEIIFSSWVEMWWLISAWITLPEPSRGLTNFCCSPERYCPKKLRQKPGNWHFEGLWHKENNTCASMKELLMSNEQLGPWRCQQHSNCKQECVMPVEPAGTLSSWEVPFTGAIKLVLLSQQQELCAYQLWKIAFWPSKNLSKYISL